jgi:hypothetical protein
MKTIKKAQTGAKTKKTDLNTTLQKAKFDNRYNEIYRQTKNDSINESNKTIGKTYLDLKKRKGKSPSAAELRSEQDKRNKEKVSKKTPGWRISKLNAKQRAEDRFEQEMSGYDDRLIDNRNGGKHKKKMKNGGALGMKSVKAGYDKNPGVTRADIITAATKKAQNGYTGKSSLVPPLNKLVEQAGPMRKTKTKERSTDGNYVTKTVSKTTPSGTSKSTKTRRTIQGFLAGAPKVSEFSKAKKGTKVKKAQMGASVISKMAKKNQTSAPKVPKGLSTIKRPDDSMKSTTRSTMKSGGKMKKCRYGCK